VGDVLQVSGDSTAADNLEAILDGTGGTLTVAGPELITNGDFGTGDLTGWDDTSNGAGQVTYDGGSALLESVGTAGVDIATLQLTSAITGLAVGATYVLTGDLTGNDVIVAVDDICEEKWTSGANSIEFTATRSTFARLTFSNGVDGDNETSTVDNISLVAVVDVATDLSEILEDTSSLPGVAAGANGGLPLQGGAIPNADADAAGGLPISDVGGLDLDAIPTALAAVQADLPSVITKNTELDNFPFLMVLSSDHFTAATGKTVTAQRSIDGAAFAACANSTVEISSGAYKIKLATSDLNGHTIILRFTATACDDRIIIFVTKPT